MDRRALTALLFIVILLVIAWFADRLSKMPLTWQTVIAVAASLLVVILAIWIVLRRKI